MPNFLRRSRNRTGVPHNRGQRPQPGAETPVRSLASQNREKTALGRALKRFKTTKQIRGKESSEVKRRRLDLKNDRGIFILSVLRKIFDTSLVTPVTRPSPDSS